MLTGGIVFILFKNLLSSNNSFHGLKKSSKSEGDKTGLVRALVDIYFLLKV